MIDNTTPHRRRNPLTGEWILVSPHRAQRPWQGSVESVQSEEVPPYVESCYLCPGNTRSNGETNPAYTSTFCFTNDHAALLPDSTQSNTSEELFEATSERGICRVICYTPNHGKTMAQLSIEEIESIVATWKSEYESIGTRDFINYVQIFENKGQLMGASSPHPHGQLWATEHLPSLVAKEQEHQEAYHEKHSSQLLVDYAKREIEEQTRLVLENDTFVVVVPYWATWPYETLIMPKKHIPSLSDLSAEDMKQLADVLSHITKRYDKLFNTSFPYSLGIHQKPTDGDDHTEWQLHIHIYPPLLRSSTVKKYYVGYELLAEAQRDITPEAAAEKLRDINE